MAGTYSWYRETQRYIENVMASLGYVQTGTTTPNNVGSCKPTMLRPFARG